QNLEHFDNPVGDIGRDHNRGSAQTAAAGKGAQHFYNLVNVGRRKLHDCVPSIDQLPASQRRIALLAVEVSEYLLERDGSLGYRSHLVALNVYGVGESREVWPQRPYGDPCLSRLQSLYQPAIRQAAGDEFCAVFQHAREQAIGTVIDQRHIIEVDYGAPIAKLLAQIFPDSL